MTTKLIRDAFGDVIPQTQNENGIFTALANGDTSNIDFGKYKLIRDSLGDPVPQQYFDVEQNKFVHGVLGGGSGSGGGSGGSYGGKFEWRYNAVTNSLDLVVIE